MFSFQRAVTRHPTSLASRFAIGAAVLGGAITSQAAIAPGNATVISGQTAYQGNGELFMSVFDAVAKVSYTLDLGVTQNDFYGQAQQDAGYQRFWVVNDAQWASFLPQADPANLRWSVLAFDTQGGTATGQQRLFTTVKQGDEAKVRTLTNQLFTNGIGAAQAGTFFTAINTTGTHGAVGTPANYSVNGSSVNADSEPGNAYFGSTGGLTPNLNQPSTIFNSSNAVGQSSWFYYLTRSGNTQLDTVLVDEFDNIAPGSAGDGYFGFTFVDPSVTSEYAGKYLLSYTLQPAGPSAAQAAFAASIGRTEYSGAYAVRALPGTAGAASLDAGGFSRALAVANVSVVPEPASSAMWLAGIGALAWVARRRRA